MTVIKYSAYTKPQGVLETRHKASLDEGSTPSRFDTMLLALRELERRRAFQDKDFLIVETGCVREPGDYGAGYSTVIFAEFVRLWNDLDGLGELISFDNEIKHIDICRDILNSDINTYLAKHVHVVLKDSIQGLNDLAQAGKTIDLLYVDSLDYPYVEMLNLYGREGNPDNDDLSKTNIAKLSDETIRSRHWDMIRPSAEQCLNEVRAAMPVLSQNAIIIIDDAILPGGGKPILAAPELKKRNWKLLADSYQQVWSR